MRLKDLTPGSVKINIAEFLALLITCETFSPFCKGQITRLEIDNYAAKAWFDAARCPRYPYDRCAQGLHMYMLKCGMKIKTRWIPSGANVLADIFSRKHFPNDEAGHLVEGALFRVVKPKWKNVLRFIN